MGSGPSKEKTPLQNVPPRKPDNVSKGNKQFKTEEVTSVQNNNKTNINSKIDVVESKNNKSETIKSNTNNTIKVGNGKSEESQVRKSEPITSKDSKKSLTKKDLGKFESDSESEAEDIDAVLAATKNQYNQRVQQRTIQPNDDGHYPETYAQRLQREQYKHQPEGLLRQKTIYRNPQEWEIEENKVESFDVSRFKQANVLKNPQPMQSNTDDIFSPPDVPSNGHPPREDFSYRLEKKKSLPHYDTTEEALLAEIEKEYDL
ncbi:protein kinase 4-like [Dreissena polymorpha]|uniref:protein kinase 4-like n=1 Tax=Dreissena polymorpha TaxID=45954 RepID=UPI0022656344|nr:protein kinase 4-like [Dreissena polymorpha]